MTTPVLWGQVGVGVNSRLSSVLLGTEETALGIVLSPVHSCTDAPFEYPGLMEESPSLPAGPVWV